MFANKIHAPELKTNLFLIAATNLLKKIPHSAETIITMELSLYFFVLVAVFLYVLKHW